MSEWNKGYKSYGGELKEEAGTGKKWIWIVCGVLAGIFLMLFIAGVLAIFWLGLNPRTIVITKQDAENESVQKMEEAVSGSETESLWVFGKVPGENERQTAAYFLECGEEYEFPMTDTIILSANGDEIYAITQLLEINVEGLDEEILETVSETCDGIVDDYNSVEGVICTVYKGEKSFVIYVAADTTEDALNELALKGIAIIMGERGTPSFESVTRSLEFSGYTKVGN